MANQTAVLPQGPTTCQSPSPTENITPGMNLGELTWHSAGGRVCWSRWRTRAGHLWSHSWSFEGQTIRKL